MMCGIIGYSGEKEATPIILECLRRLDYRGYDSWGVSVDIGGMLSIEKAVGAVPPDVNLAQSNIGIGHVRWATHGEVTEENAHPHFDCKGQLAVAHNGIVENYLEIREKLLEKGHKFASDTDTECISHWLEDEIGQGLSLEQAVLRLAQIIDGSYAYLALCHGKMVGTRKGLPLVVGLGIGGCYIGSDALAFSRFTNQVMTLGDNEIAVLSKSSVEVYDNEGTKIEKHIQSLDGAYEYKKGVHKYFMLKEMSEQPLVLERTIKQDKEQFTNIALDILRAKQVIIAACGSSRYASLVGRYLFSKVGKKFCEVVMASEFGYFADSVDSNTVVIAVSQSGETADVISGVSLAKERGAKIFSIINRPNSMLCELSEQVVYLNCGYEIGVAATKTFLSQLAVFYLIAFSMVNSFDEACSNIRDISKLIDETIKNNKNGLKELCRRFGKANDFYYIARGINFAVASEGALKLKEISYIHAEGMPAGELKHGTLALIEKGTPVVVICPDDYTYQDTWCNAKEAKARGAYIIGVSDRYSDLYDFWVKIPTVDELLYPMVEIIPLQFLAYYMADYRGLNPDKPRNLAKSVTVK